jgi:hypothetical protein
LLEAENFWHAKQAFGSAKKLKAISLLNGWDVG